MLDVYFPPKINENTRMQASGSAGGHFDGGYYNDQRHLQNISGGKKSDIALSSIRWRWRAQRTYGPFNCRIFMATRCLPSGYQGHSSTGKTILARFRSNLGTFLLTRRVCKRFDKKTAKYFLVLPSSARWRGWRGEQSLQRKHSCLLPLAKNARFLSKIDF